MINYTIAGVDEAGRGPLAGPVVAAAVIIEKYIPGITDSKKISEKNRNKFASLIKEHARSVGVGICSPKEIDSLNIHNATLLAMKRAILNLDILPYCYLIDGKFTPEELSLPAFAIVKGDSSNYAIAAASIIAKTTRDNIMFELANKYPHYDFLSHKGYPTKQHIHELELHGISDIHRKTFNPVKNYLL